MPLNLLFIPGDGYDQPILGSKGAYSTELINPFIEYLTENGVNVTYVPLLESDPNVTYSELELNNYADYIHSFCKPKLTYTVYGISKGCYWAIVFSKFYHKLVRKLVLVEPTTMIPKLLRKFERERNNAFIDELYYTKHEIPDLPAYKKALDVIVSNPPIRPKNPAHIVITTRDNQDNECSKSVMRMKTEYAKWVGAKFDVIDSNHCVDMDPEKWKYLLQIITL